MTSLDSVILKTEDVLGILRACQETGVAEITFGPLHVTFGAGTSQPASLAPQAPPLQPEELEALERKAIAEAELEVKREALATLHASDPDLFEALVTSGDLIDGHEDVQRPDEALSGG